MTGLAGTRALVRSLLALDAPLLIVAGISFVSQIGIAVMLPLLPLYALSLEATPVQLGLLTSAFAVANTVGQLAAGLALDRAGARAFIRGGTAIYAGANALIATAADALALIAYRTLAGIGAGANIVATRLYVAQSADPARMAYVQGVLGAAASAGSIAGPAVGGIASLSDLRLPFVLVAITSGIGFLGSLVLPRPARPASAAPAGGGPTTALNRSVIALLLAQVCLLASYGGFITAYGAFATQRLGWTTLEVALVFTVIAVGSIVLGPPLSYLADRVGRRGVATLSLAVIASWGLVFVLGLPRPFLYADTVLTGGALTAFGGAWFALLSEASPAERRGRTFGIVSGVSNVGIVIGATLAAAIWEQVDLAWAMVVSSAGAGLGVLAMLAVPRESRFQSPAVPQER